MDVLGALRTPATQEALARDEQLLVDQARQLRYDHFVRAAAYWRHRADAYGAERDAELRRSRRDAYLVRSFQGRGWGPCTSTRGRDHRGRGAGPPGEGTVRSGLVRGQKRPSGGTPTRSELARTPAQRRADALVEMATRSKTAPPDGRRPVPLFTVLVGFSALHGQLSQLEDGIMVQPWSPLAWLSKADLERATFRPGGRVEIGAPATLSSMTTAGLRRAICAPITRVENPPSSRLFTGATRRAIEVRDRECTHELCDVPAASCQIDHIQPWALGGPTTQENGRLLCGKHNRMRNQ